MKEVIVEPARGMLWIAGPTTYPFTMGTTCVTPSPESMIVPVKSAVDDLAAELIISVPLLSYTYASVSNLVTVPMT